LANWPKNNKLINYSSRGLIIFCLTYFNFFQDNTDQACLPAEKLHFGYTKKQLKVFFSLVFLSLNDLMGYSAIAPFFPVVVSD